ncbi:MAG: PspC domain-containing protein [Bacteroidales bacterium]|nr:PspC domain-containing protein [Bacteroidales bacterium]
MATLRKSSNKMLAGVAAGYAEYFGVDVTLMRIIFVVGTICASVGLWVYLISWILMPE